MHAIRCFEAGDADAWAALRAKLWPHADGTDLAREADAFAAGAPIANVAAVFIAENEAAETTGFLELAVRPYSDGCDSMPVPHVEGWYVEPAARGTGAGRALMQSAEAWSRAHGFTELASDTEIENEASLRAHERCGFSEVERLVKLRKPLP